jgi:hypothetical protein
MKFALLVDNKVAMRGDGSSVAVIYNNLTGVNSPWEGDSVEGLAKYRRFMGQHLFSNEDAFAEGTQVALVALPSDTIATYRIGDSDPVRVTSETVGEGHGGFASLGEKYPEPIASKYSTQDPIEAYSGRFDDYRYAGPKVKTTVRGTAAQHFCVYEEPEHRLLQDFQSREGRKAFDDAVLFAEQRGLPWQVSGGAEVFDPTTGQLWSL